ncbi:uncharacterized protein LOC120268224 [Dioscorea cayenensis subsp. rotundata]|uniref:Uncharacterized protein LOC120268224 n=1 Tax=Dioscorea cayennensis subsp. rotundata TaxID=55577 RepID=A0AB40BVX9_DIOCR|nr:uncharacterized protein LOC120268224 [Dioscorea cayenensis subsp. rotundata]
MMTASFPFELQFLPIPITITHVTTSKLVGNQRGIVASDEQVNQVPATQAFSAIRNPTKSSSSRLGNASVGKSQVKCRDGKRPGNADKKRKVWVPPGVGTPAGASDVYKKPL